MDGVDKILSGYYLPVILLMLWSFIGIIRGIVECIVNKRLRTQSLQQQPLLHLNNSLVDNIVEIGNHNEPRNDHDGDDDNGSVDGNDNNRNSKVISMSAIDNDRRCCHGKLIRPTINTILLQTALFSYSIVKTTMLLLQCRPSPLDVDGNYMIMYSAGNVSCYGQW
jgi:hypothetical protein